MNMIRILAEVDMNSVLNNGLSIGEKLADGGKMILIGMGFVFGVIFSIWLMLTVFRLFVYEIPKAKAKKAEKIKKTVEAVKGQDQSAQTEIPAYIQEAAGREDETVTVAVITAALAAYLGSASENGEALPFKVVSFKRKKSGTPWNS